MKIKSLIKCNLIILFLLSSTALAEEGYGVPQRDSNNIIIASYNIKWLGQTQHDPNKLATVIEKFDVCGILEVKKESEVSRLVDALEKKNIANFNPKVLAEMKAILAKHPEAIPQQSGKNKKQ